MKRIILFLLLSFLFVIGWCGLWKSEAELNAVDNKKLSDLQRIKLMMKSYIMEKKTFPEDQYKLFEYIKPFQKKSNNNMLEYKDDLTYTAIWSKTYNWYVGRYILWMKMENPKHCDIWIYSDEGILKAINNNKELKKLFYSPFNQDTIHKVEKKLKEIYWNKKNFKKWCLKIISGKIVLNYGWWQSWIAEY